jgi:UDP-glucose 4-epimerase
MRIVITGGAGFIGSTIADRLLAEGHDVAAFDNLETGSRHNVSADVRLVVGDIRNPDALEKAMIGADAVVHQAAMVSVSLSVAEPGRCWDVNATGTRRVLEAARRAGCRRVVLASSAAVYGNGPTLPKHEDLPVDPASPYAYAKWLNEADARYYAEHLGLETICLRYFNVFGPRQRPDSPYSGVISIAAERLLSGQPFTVFGTGEQTRDFVFVEDVAGAVTAALAVEHVPHAVVNVARGERVSLLQLLAQMGRAVGRSPDLRFAGPRQGDVMHSLADVSRLRHLLAYQAEVSLADGLERTLSWMRLGLRA